MIIENGWIQEYGRDLRVATLDELRDFLADSNDGWKTVNEYMEALTKLLLLKMADLPDEIRLFLDEDESLDCLLGRYHNNDDLTPFWTTLVETYKKVKRYCNCTDHDFEPIPTTTLDHCVYCGAIRDAG